MILQGSSGSNFQGFLGWIRQHGRCVILLTRGASSNGSVLGSRRCHRATSQKQCELTNMNWWMISNKLYTLCSSAKCYIMNHIILLCIETECMVYTDMKSRHVFEQQNDFDSWWKLMRQRRTGVTFKCWLYGPAKAKAPVWAQACLGLSAGAPTQMLHVGHSDSPVNYFCKARAWWMSMWFFSLTWDALMLKLFATRATIPPIFWGLPNPVP